LKHDTIEIQRVYVETRVVIKLTRGNFNVFIIMTTVNN